VVRDGLAREVPAEELVPGDLVRVASGQAFPADGVIVAGDELQTDESALTGESYPVRKRPLARAGVRAGGDGRAASVDGAHWGFAGTRLLTGEASLRVLLTGGETLYGEIVARPGGARARTTAARVGGLVRVLLVRRRALRDPGGGELRRASARRAGQRRHARRGGAAEFRVFTVFLGVGVHRLARRKALVRRSVTVEDICRVTSNCSDKTGTITQGELRLAHLLPGPAGSEARLCELAALASRAASGDPLDEAILRACAERGVAVPGARPLALSRTEDRRRETAVARRGARAPGRDQGRAGARALAVRARAGRARELGGARHEAGERGPQVDRVRLARARRGGLARRRAGSRARARRAARVRGSGA
jgi:Ca2+-transporting ATPase